MLGITAAYADAWTTAWFAKLDDRLHMRLANMDAALSAARRDRSSRAVSVGVVLNDDDRPDAGDRAARMLETCRAAGIDEAIVLLQPMTEPALERLAEGRAL